MPQHLAALDLCQAFLDFAQEPVVVVNRSFDRFLGQRLRIRSALVRDAATRFILILRRVREASITRQQRQGRALHAIGQPLVRLKRHGRYARFRESGDPATNRNPRQASYRGPPCGSSMIAFGAPSLLRRRRYWAPPVALQGLPESIQELRDQVIR